jgi:hypothetical protein
MKDKIADLSMSVPPSRTQIKARIRRRKPKPEKISKELCQVVTEFAKRLQAEFGLIFAGSQRVKHDVARMLKSQLPPLPRRPGRPGSLRVTAAIHMRDQLRLSQPGKPMKEIWREIYRTLISGYDALPPIERRTERDRLHRQVRWRLYARRRGRKLRGG